MQEIIAKIPDPSDSESSESNMLCVYENKRVLLSLQALKFSSHLDLLVYLHLSRLLSQYKN
jgi:hypothetical protein